MSIQNGLAITLQNRKALKKILDFHSLEQLNQIPNGFNNNILWNCAHVITVQQMLTYGLNNLPFGIPKEFVFRFTPGTKPDAVYDAAFVYDVKSLLFTSFEQFQADINDNKFVAFNPFMTALKFEINDLEKAVAFNQYHESLHMGHILNLMKFV
ncbi:MAG TPA: DinB family protein [Saprospiraceae bacterium]|mgnify:CR=1 FL=1|nr:DinB family protein [Saprospiraceae bacterium]